jgi:hypothetical protein
MITELTVEVNCIFTFRLSDLCKFPKFRGVLSARRVKRWNIRTS